MKIWQRLNALCCLLLIFLSNLSIIAQERWPMDDWLEDSRELAASTFQRSLALDVWREENISILAHYLLAINQTDSSQAIIRRVFDHEILQSELLHLHRGEFLSILADFDCKVGDTINFKDGGPILVMELLEYERQIFTDSDKQYFNKKEEYYGQEFGWLLKGFSHYLNEGEPIKPGFGINDLAQHILKIGINRNIEEGCHDLEALAKYVNSKVHNTNRVLQKQISKYLRDQAAHELTLISKEGQAYAYSRRFDGSILNCADTFCKVLDNLNRQSHFLEWTSEAGLLPSLEKRDLIFKRFRSLLSQAEAEISKRVALGPEIKREDILIVSSLSHAISALNVVQSNQ